MKPARIAHTPLLPQELVDAIIASSGLRQAIIRIDKKRAFHKNETIFASFKHARGGNSRLHLLGLVLNGRIHSHISHLYALLEAAKEFHQEKHGELATVLGRYYAMRDKRWERVKIAVDGVVGGEGAQVRDSKTIVDEIKANYEKDRTDEFSKPIIVNGEERRIKDGDTLFFFNYRSDRMRELVTGLGLPDKPMEVTIPKDLAMTNVLAEWLAKQGVKQAHVAETEKYAHVTFFFNGGIEKQFDAEERFMVDSPKVATYDLQPEMSVQGVADKVAELVKSGEHEFVMCNFAPPDMAPSTPPSKPSLKRAVSTVAAACAAAGYILLITADHGNAEQMQNPETDERHTAHTCGAVPFILVGGKEDEYALKDNEKDGKEKTAGSEKKEGEEEEEGALCDVAPTVLELMGLPKPEEMTGRSLLAKK
ncbi:BPG-independent [Mycena galopus ATCC 62051]|nr:BPG-independent [Mycena galopus ATCC 62051]